MKIQSLSVAVPTSRCINDCKFCVSKMRTDEYKNQMNYNLPFFDLYFKDYMKRLEFARDNGCNTLMLTGSVEPQQNRRFLSMFGVMMMVMDRPFRNIEMQTTGVNIDRNYLRFLRNHVGVNTISVSISSFDDSNNAIIAGMPDGHWLILKELCDSVKEYDFTLRLSINLTAEFDSYTPETLFEKAASYGADQVTLRVLYESGNDTEQDIWIRKHRCDPKVVEQFQEYQSKAGIPIHRLEYGYTQYMVHGMSVIIDTDCMAESVKEEYKYLILRPDCKLYSRWDTPASLVF